MPAAAAVRPRRPKPGAADTARSALTPERWIEAATEVLVDRGIDSVRVDVLAQQLQVTRGSFYWHFRDREDLLRRVLQAWREEATVQLTLRLEGAHADPREQLRDILSLPIRAWARRDAMARQAVDEADGARVAYISQVFSSLGFGLAEARWRAFATYAYVVAESQIAAPIAQLQRAERDRFIEKLMLLPLP